MQTEIIIERRVEFSETDMAGIVHFSNYFRWMEAAEAALFRAWDVPLFEHGDSAISGWPRVRAFCDYKAPIRFGDTVQIKLKLKEVRIRALVYAATIRTRSEDSGEFTLAARGGFTTVPATADIRGKHMKGTTLPAALKPLLEQKHDKTDEAKSPSSS